MLQSSGGPGVYDVALRDDIRDWVLVQGHAQRAAAKHFGIARDTVARLLAEGAGPTIRTYRRHAPRSTPVADIVVPHIERWLAQNEQFKRSAVGPTCCIRLYCNVIRRHPICNRQDVDRSARMTVFLEVFRSLASTICPRDERLSVVLRLRARRPERSVACSWPW